LKIIFFGSPDYVCRIIDETIRLGHDISCLVTQKSKKGKRKNILKTPVTLYSEKHNIEIYSPDDLSDISFTEAIKHHKPDLILIFAYGKLLPKNIIDIPKHGCLNIHCSILPRWRGAAPIQRALLNQDSETGVTFFKINENLDQGKILLIIKQKILKEDDTLALQNKLSQLAVDNLEKVFDKVIKGSEMTNQDEDDSTYASKINKNEAIIDWTESPDQIIAKIKAFICWPVAEAIICDHKIKVWEAKKYGLESNIAAGNIVDFTRNGLTIACRQDAIIITKLQLPGRNVISALDLFNSQTEFSRDIKNSINM